MASKARTKRATKKARVPEPPDAFFRPFVALVEERKRAEQKKKEAEKKAEKAAAQEKEKKKKAEREALAEAPRAAPRRDEQANATAVAETFAMYMAGVAMLDDRQRRRVPRTETVPARGQPQGTAPAMDLDADARARLRSLVAEGVRFEVVDDGERIEGRRLDIDPRELRRLRRGAYTIDGRLDLHGMTVVEARQQIEMFVRKRRTDGDRVVALIHGRGNHSPRGVAVLRGEIAAWLSQGPVAHHVAVFASAPPDEGGTGALLVLLAR